MSVCLAMRLRETDLLTLRLFNLKVLYLPSIVKSSGPQSSFGCILVVCAKEHWIRYTARPKTSLLLLQPKLGQTWSNKSQLQ